MDPSKNATYRCPHCGKEDEISKEMVDEGVSHLLRFSRHRDIEEEAAIAMFKAMLAAAQV